MILITGCDSTAGRVLVNELISRNLQVRCHDIDAPKKLPRECEVISGLLSNEREIKNALSGVDTLVHFLEVPESSSYGRKQTRWLNNEMPRKLLTIAAQSGISHAIIKSTWQVYGLSKKSPIDENHKLNPSSQLGDDRRTLENFCKSDKLSPMKITILRPAFTLGPETDSTALLLMLYLALAQDKESRAHIISGGKNLFEFLDYSDLAKAVALTIEKKAAGIFNLSGGGAPASETIMELFKKYEPRINIFNFSSIKANYLSFFLKIIRSHHLTGDHLKILTNNLVMNTDAARSTLGWSPKYDSISAFENMIKWYMENKMKTKP
jgi:nucleoside-diphosphate-sugar epimerase